MRCENCGLPLLGTEVFCPQCGVPIASEPAPPVEAEPAPEGAPPAALEATEPAVIEVADVPLVATPPAEPAARPRPRAGRSAMAQPRLPARLIGPLGLGILAGCLLFFVIGLGALGAIQGLRLRNRDQFQSAAQHYAQGLVHLQNGDYELAAAEFEWALRLRQNYPEAQQKLIEARSKASRQPSPSSSVAQGQASALLSEGRSAYDRGAWDEAIVKLEALLAVDPHYEQALVQKLLVSAYTNSGLKLVNEDRLEEAIRRFDQALALQPDNPDVQNQRRLATLYQAALSVWGVDWGQAIRSFSAVYALKPDYKDTSQRLHQAYARAGEAAAAQAAWCDALQYYKSALNLVSTPEIAARRDEAAQNCASSTGTPGTPAPSGTFVGTFEGYEDIRFRTHDWAKVTGRVVNAAGQGVPGLRVKLSAFDWSGTAGTDADGYYAFENLNHEITFTVSLVDLPVQPVDVRTRFGYACIANFTQRK